MSLCRQCKTNKAVFPDRNAMGRPLKRICRDCHRKDLLNDLQHILDDYDRARRKDALVKLMFAMGKHVTPETRHPEGEGNPVALALLDQWYATLDGKSPAYWDQLLREIETHPLQLPRELGIPARRSRSYGHE